MIVLHSNNQIMSIIMDHERSSTAEYINYLEIPEVAANQPTLRALISSQNAWDEYTIQGDQLLKNGVIIPIANDIDKDDIKAEYQAAITRLNQIENATNPTNAQVIAAVRDMAKYQRLTLKFLARLLT